MMSFRIKKPKNETKAHISKAARKAGMDAMSKAMMSKPRDKATTVRKVHKVRKV